MGSNSHGQLGIADATVKSKNTPTLVEASPLIDQIVTKVSCGNYHSLALTERGLGYAWGQGKFGALGSGRSDNLFEPLTVNLMANDTLMDISAGGQHSAFLTKEEILFVCGDGSKGQLGIGDCECVFSLAPVRDQRVKKVSCGESHTLIYS